MLIRRLFPAAIVLTACHTTGGNTTNQTPTTPRSSFVNACADNAAEWRMTPNQAAGVCACAYDTLRSRYTAAQWQQHINNDTNPDRDPVLNRRMNEAANTCVRRHLSR